VQFIKVLQIQETAELGTCGSRVETELVLLVVPPSRVRSAVRSSGAPG